MLIKRANLFSGLFIFFVLFFSVKVSAGTIPDDFVKRLKCELNLTDDQAVWIKSGIIGYVSAQGKSRSQVVLTQRIEQVLDETQRSSWKAIKSSFFKDLDTRLAVGEKKNKTGSDCFSSL